ncbi:MAG: DUF4159 domain-containing protein [Polyangiaceae bacterium]|nr:DUF4159 domain-containing protein [Polyangiaceae bacterium]
MRRFGDRGRACAALVALALLGVLALPTGTRAIGEASDFELVGVRYGNRTEDPRPTARRRLSWAVRTRTSIETHLAPGMARLDDPAIFESPFLYFSGDEELAPLSDAEILGLRRFVEFGGFVLVDDAAPEAGGFDRAIRRELARAFPDDPLRPIDSDHTIFRSFYLLDRPVGRVRGPEHLEGIERDGRLAVVYSRHDLGGAWARDNLGTYLHSVVPGGEEQREAAYRLGVNLVMYALCLDYKDDQVHAPFIMRRRAGSPGAP